MFESGTRSIFGRGTRFSDMQPPGAAQTAAQTAAKSLLIKIQFNKIELEPKNEPPSEEQSVGVLNRIVGRGKFAVRFVSRFSCFTLPDSNHFRGEDFLAKI